MKREVPAEERREGHSLVPQCAEYGKDEPPELGFYCPSAAWGCR